MDLIYTVKKVYKFHTNIPKFQYSLAYSRRSVDVFLVVPVLFEYRYKTVTLIDLAVFPTFIKMLL